MALFGVPLTHTARVNQRTEEAYRLIVSGGSLDALADLVRVKNSGSRVDLNWRASKVPSEHGDGSKPWESGYSLLHFAVSYHPGAIEILLSVGADIEIRTISTNPDYDGRTSLYCASRLDNGSVDILLKHGANAHTSRTDGWTVVHSLAGNGRGQMLRKFLETTGGKDVDSAYCTKVPDFSCRSGGLGILKKRKEITVKNWVPIHRAAGKGHAECVQILLDFGASVNEARSDGTTAIHWAAAEGRVKVLEVLVNFDKTDITKTLPTGLTPLHEAARFGHLKCVSVLASKYNETQLASADREGLTALHYAALGGFADVCHELANRGCKVDVRDCRDNTPLHLAITSRRAVAVRRLLALGASPRLRTKNDIDGFALAKQVGDPAVWDVLSEYLKVGIDDFKEQSYDTDALTCSRELSVPRVAGMLYIGDLDGNTGKPQGKGSLYLEKPDGSQVLVFDGHFRQGVREGYGTQYIETAQVDYSAAISGTGAQRGESVSCTWYNDEPQYHNLCVLNSREGVYNGPLHPHKALDISAPLTQYTLSMLDRNGVGSYKSVDGSRYFGFWQENKRHGWGVYHDGETRTVYYGMWHNDMRHGRGVSISLDGVVYHGDFELDARGRVPVTKHARKAHNDQEPNGALYYPSGQAIAGVFEHGDSILHAKIHPAKPATAIKVLVGQTVENFFSPDTMPGEKWKGLFAETIPSPLPPHPAIKAENFERTIYLALCGGGIFQKCFDRFVQFFQYFYGSTIDVDITGEAARKVLVMALDDFKSFAEDFTDIILPAYKSQFKIRKRRLLEYVSELLLMHVYDSVFRKLYTQVNVDMDAVFSSKLRAFASTKPSDFGIDTKLIPKCIEDECCLDIGFEVYLNFVERVREYSQGITFATVYTPSQEEGDAEEGTFRNAKDLVKLVENFVKTNLIGPEAKPEVRHMYRGLIYPLAIAVMSVFPLITLPSMKSQFLELANETMMIEVESYQQQHNKGGKSRGADDLLPVFYFVLSHAHVECWNSELNFLDDFWDIVFDNRMARLQSTVTHLQVMDLEVRDEHDVIVSLDSVAQQVQDLMLRHVDHPSFNFLAGNLSELCSWISIQLPHAAENANGMKQLDLHKRSHSLFRSPSARELTLQVLHLLGIDPWEQDDDTPSLKRESTDPEHSLGTPQEESIPRLQYKRVMRDEFYRTIAQELTKISQSSPLTRKLEDLARLLVDIDAVKQVKDLITGHPEEWKVALSLRNLARILSISNPSASRQCTEIADSLDTEGMPSEYVANPAAYHHGHHSSSSSFSSFRRESVSAARTPRSAPSPTSAPTSTETSPNAGNDSPAS